MHSKNVKSRKLEKLHSSKDGYEAFLVESPSGSDDGFVFVTAPEPYPVSTVVHHGKTHALRHFFDPPAWIAWAKEKIASIILG